MNDESNPDTGRRPLAKATAERFASEFQDVDHTSATRVFYAPGRVNLIGDHTDYNGGLVFPCAVSSGIALAIAPRSDGKYRFKSANFDYSLEIESLEQLIPIAREWVNYPMGVISELKQLQDAKQSWQASGFDCFFSGDLPDGAGVSSSAAIEVVTAFAINAFAELNLSALELVKLCQRAENNFVGVPCGIMDQFAVTMAKAEQAIAIDCNTLRHEHVPLKLAGACFILANTNQKRDMAEAGYNDRVRECQRAIELLQPRYKIKSLAELEPDALASARDLFPDDDIAFKRTAHVVTENQRVKMAMAALQSNDMKAFGQLMIGSHHSLRDLYEVSSEPLEHLVKAALDNPATLGTRLTGAGFGGCTVSLVETGDVAAWIASVGAAYEASSARQADFFVFKAASGVSEINLDEMAI